MNNLLFFLIISIVIITIISINYISTNKTFTNTKDIHMFGYLTNTRKLIWKEILVNHGDTSIDISNVSGIKTDIIISKRIKLKFLITKELQNESINLQKLYHLLDEYYPNLKNSNCRIILYNNICTSYTVQNILPLNFHEIYTPVIIINSNDIKNYIKSHKEI